MGPLVLVRFFPKAAQVARVESILRNMVVNTRQEPACRRYDLYESKSPEGRRIFCLLERYDNNGTALQAHRDTAYYKEYRANIIELLEQPIEVTFLEPVDER